MMRHIICRPATMYRSHISSSCETRTTFLALYLSTSKRSTCMSLNVIISVISIPFHRIKRTDLHFLSGPFWLIALLLFIGRDTFCEWGVHTFFSFCGGRSRGSNPWPCARRNTSALAQGRRATDSYTHENWFSINEYLGCGISHYIPYGQGVCAYTHRSSWAFSNSTKTRIITYYFNRKKKNGEIYAR